MGGLLGLLAAVTMSVTYGWQPDGRGGVEYIIQVPPEKLEQLRSSGTGEITSTIDPKVRGLVSKVVVRVGHGDLPRVSPNQPALEDRVAVEVPSLRGSDVEVLKPNPGENTFRLPDALNQVADRTKESLQAGANQITNNANDALQRLQQKSNITPSNQRETSRDVDHVRDRLNLGQNNASIVGQNDLRRANPGDPDRVSANGLGPDQRQPERDNKWFNLQNRRSAPSTDPVERPQTRLGQDFVGPQQPNSRNQNDLKLRMGQDPATDPGRRNSSGLGSTATFANVPNSNSNSSLRRNSPLLRSASTASAQPERDNRSTLSYAQGRLQHGERNTQDGQLSIQGDQRLLSQQDRLQSQQQVNFQNSRTGLALPGDAAARIAPWNKQTMRDNGFGAR